MRYISATVILLLLGVLGYILIAKPWDHPQSSPEVVVAAQQIVLSSLRPGVKVQFGPDNQTEVAAYPDGKFRVSGWVDVPAADGRMERQAFTVVVRRAGKSWISETILVAPKI
jgi:hypothetical protein